MLKIRRGVGGITDIGGNTREYLVKHRLKRGLMGKGEESGAV